jgi:hypothetical protein
MQEAQERRALEERIAQLERQVVEREDTIRQQSRQIQTIQGLGAEERLTRIPHAVRIELDSLTGGYAPPGRVGDEGVVVYLRPYDRDGDVVKAAGRVRIRLTDPEAPESARDLGEYWFDEEALRKAWYGRLMTSHYTLRCPWRAGPPANPNITVHVKFYDLVTGQSYEQVAQARVTLPPSADR